ncbi:MAG: hypothetical protein AAF802_24330 [Planctomycetota bacterium]
MRLLDVCPRRSKRGATIVTTTAWRIRVLSLGAYYRRVEIDPVNRMIKIFQRYLWFIRRQCLVPFEEVEAVTYGYKDVSYGSWQRGPYEAEDCFTVGLRLADDSELVLHEFRGRGELINESILPDWCFRPTFLGFSGDQEQESRDYVELVSRLVEVATIPHRGY